jgi:hypothetical protein
MFRATFTILGLAILMAPSSSGQDSDFRLTWEKNILTVSGTELPGESVTIWYLEAYCRSGSTDREWSKTTIGHSTELIAAGDDGKSIHLRCKLSDGVVVDHRIRAVSDGVAFDLVARNPTDKRSEAHWAQPCVRVDRFTGATQADYLPKSFVFLDGDLHRMPTRNWATEARYTPGQVWRPATVDPDDVNPRPLSSEIPSNGLIGCFSKNDDWVLASAWEPWQELFQGVIVCLHSDFRIGGLDPGQSKTIRGKLYLMPAADSDVSDLLSAYRRDFPEHHNSKTSL